MNSQAEVAWDEALGGWTVSGYELVRAALLDPGTFSSEGISVADNLAGEAMLVTDGAVHDAVRAIWAPFFAPASAVRWREGLETFAGTLLAPFVERIAAGESVDLVPLFEQYAETVLLQLFEFNDISDGQFRRWYKLLLNTSAFRRARKPRPKSTRCSKASWMAGRCGLRVAKRWGATWFR